MHSICIEECNKIIVKFEPTGDEWQNYRVNDVLCTGDYKLDGTTYVYTNYDLVEFEKSIQQTVDFFIREFGRNNIELCAKIKNYMTSIETSRLSYTNALHEGKKVKDKQKHSPNVSKKFRRHLMDYQKKSVEHMIVVGNAANFSVPGSGKTTITYAALSRWLDDETVQKILVIGPTASFLPWLEEYEICFGKQARFCRFNNADLTSKIHELGPAFDLFLMHFQTAMNHQSELKKFMCKWKTALIIDESHYIKSPNLRKWASAAIQIAPYAAKRIILSGTPMPNSAKDLWTQITFLWPKNYPLGNQQLYNNYVSKYGIDKYQSTLNSLFCRIKKDDLDLPIPKWHTRTIPLNRKQQDIYDAIAAQTLQEFNKLTIRDQGQLQKFRIARMIRLLQTASNPGLLYEKSDEYAINKDTFSEEFGFACTIEGPLPKITPTLVEQIKNYSQYEIPSKMVSAAQLAKQLVQKGNKVIIWNSFIHNMSIFKNRLLKEFEPIVINGTVSKEPDDMQNRDQLINKFKDNPDFKILIASPASLGESVSLHKNLQNESVCNHAIYLDRNFNGAQYMQSMDRIHRIGMDRSIEVNYYLIIAKNTIDEVIHRRLNEKWRNMLNALEDDMLQSLEIEPEPTTLNYDEFNEDYKQTIDYLRESYQK